MDQKSPCPACRFKKPKPTHQDFGVTRQVFDEWRSPRFGTANPTNLTNPFWVWQIQSRIKSYWMIREMLTAEEIEKCGEPESKRLTWSMERKGQTLTNLPDGRMVLIGGQDEDCLYPRRKGYNDVIVIDDSEKVTIYGYPEDCFPKTKFHSATLAGKQIVIVGNWHPWENPPGINQLVYTLDTDSFEIKKVETSGDISPAISEHRATLFPNGKAIRVNRGYFNRGRMLSEIDNNEEWMLDLTTWNWKRLTYRNWPVWEFRRKDKQPHHLEEYAESLENSLKALKDESDSWDTMKFAPKEKARESREALKKVLGFEPDLELLKTLYHPSRFLFNTTKDREGEVERTVIHLFGTPIRFNEDFPNGIQMTVEGNLSDSVLNSYIGEILGKLALLEGTEWEVEQIRSLL